MTAQNTKIFSPWGCKTEDYFKCSGKCCILAWNAIDYQNQYRLIFNFRNNPWHLLPFPPKNAVLETEPLIWVISPVQWFRVRLLLPRRFRRFKKTDKSREPIPGPEGKVHNIVECCSFFFNPRLAVWEAALHFMALRSKSRNMVNSELGWGRHCRGVRCCEHMRVVYASLLLQRWQMSTTFFKPHLKHIYDWRWECD